MRQLISQILFGISNISLMLCLTYYRQMHCLFFFGEPDFSEIETDLFNY